MSDDNKRNVLYFEAPTMRSLFETIDQWQEQHRKRLNSLNVQKDGNLFCCIAVTNPTEVVIVAGVGDDVAYVFDGRLCVQQAFH